MRENGLFVIWIQKGFTAENFQGNDSDSGTKVGVKGRKSELQTKSPRYSPESEPNRPEKGPECGLGASTETPLKALLNPPKLFVLFLCPISLYSLLRHLP